MLNLRQFSRDHLLNQISNSDRAALQDIANKIKAIRQEQSTMTKSQGEKLNDKISQLEADLVTLQNESIERALVILNEGYRR